MLNFKSYDYSIYQIYNLIYLLSKANYNYNSFNIVLIIIKKILSLIFRSALCNKKKSYNIFY